ncbi:hypothetical protein GQ457_03G019760 [Hibiscus cannabinus]
MWQLLPFAIIRYIWKIIFQGKSLDIVQLVWIAKSSATWWWKAIKVNSKIHLDSIIADPFIFSLLGDDSNSSVVNVPWSPPHLGFLKFNVDGACSKDGQCGVGGVLRDDKGVTLMKFSHSVGTGSTLLAEILAIKFDVDYFVK